MQEQWKRIRSRLQSLGCLNEMALLPGASPSELDELEQHLGCALPAPFRQFLQIHNGQTGFGLVYGNTLLSVSGIREQWDNWRGIDERAMNADSADFMASDPEGHIKPLYCNPAWIPFTDDCGGNHFGLDFDPDSLGKPGQVIAFGRDEDTKRLLAGSFELFTDDYIAWLERAVWNGEYLVVEGSA